MLGHVPLDHQPLRDPVHLAGQPLRARRRRARRAPRPTRRAAASRSRRCPAARGTGTSCRSTPAASRSRTARGRSRASPSGVPVVSWLISRIARIGFSRVRSRITVFASTIRSTRSVMPTFMNVVHSLMLESPTITWRRRNRSASACGSSRVLMIGRERVVAAETPSQMCSARCAMQYCAPAGRGAPSRAAPDLARDEERDQHVGHPSELAVRGDEVVLVAAVGVAGRVGVVLEEVDLAGDALLVEPHLGAAEERFEDPLPRLVVRDEVRTSSHSGVAYSGWSRRRGRDARRSPGRRWRTDPSGRRAGTGSGRPRPATAAAGLGTCT